MKIFNDSNPNFGIAFRRITDALHRYAPETVEWVADHTSADVTILHVVGGEEFEKLRSYDLSKVIIYQHCLFTTGIDVEEWKPFWKDCRAVVSWNTLDKLVPNRSKFLRLPLGAEPDLYTPIPIFNKNIDLFSTGHVAKTENIDDLYEACRKAGKVLHHTGQHLKYSPNWYKYCSEMSDQDFASTLARARYVAGLREIEGFEMHCIEGAMSGAVPIVPNLPTYDYYDTFAIKVNLDDTLVDQLTNILLGEYVPLTEEQVAFVRDKFSWKSILDAFYREIL